MDNALLQSLAPAWQRQDDGGLPSWFRERQRRALAAALAADWPGRGSEDWKYTSLHALGQRRAGVRAPGPGGRRGGWDRPGLAFVDGALSAANAGGLPDGVELSAFSAALAGDDEGLRFAIAREAEDGDVFDHVNAAFAREGAWLRVADGAAGDDWLHLDMRGEGEPDAAAWHLTHRIEVGAGARLRLVCDLSAGGQPGLATVASRIRVKRGGRLELVWLNAASDTMATIARTRLDLDAGAALHMQALDAGGAPSRHDLRIGLRGEGAHAELGGVFLLQGRRHADLQLELRHDCPDATSRTTWRAIAGDRSRAVFSGHIHVAPGADGTDARLGCKSLLASAQAQVDARPVLEIHADDVKCAHGATVGQLDEQALFYLRTRGLPPARARALLLTAFCAEAFGDAAPAPARERLAAWLDEVAA